MWLLYNIIIRMLNLLVFNYQFLKLVPGDTQVWPEIAAATRRPLDKIPYLKIVQVSHDGNQVGHLPHKRILFWIVGVFGSDEWSPPHVHSFFLFFFFLRGEEIDKVARAHNSNSTDAESNSSSSKKRKAYIH